MLRGYFFYQLARLSLWIHISLHFSYVLLFDRVLMRNTCIKLEERVWGGRGTREEDKSSAFLEENRFHSEACHSKEIKNDHRYFFLWAKLGSEKIRGMNKDVGELSLNAGGWLWVSKGNWAQEDTSFSLSVWMGLRKILCFEIQFKILSFDLHYRRKGSEMFEFSP